MNWYSRVEESGVLTGPISESVGFSFLHDLSHRKPRDRVVQIPPLLSGFEQFKSLLLKLTWKNN